MGEQEQGQSVWSQFWNNMLRNPGQAVTDGLLYVADKAGLPSNATNLLRSLNTSIPQRASAAVRGGVTTLFNDKSFEENYNDALHNIDPVTDYFTIEPLTNTNSNYSQEELDALNRMVDKRGQITNASIKAGSTNGRYGANSSIKEYLTNPEKVVQSSIGQASGKNGYIYDVFDTNTLSDEAQADNENYWQTMKKDPGLNYATLRAFLPYVDNVDIMPDKHKVKTTIKLQPKNKKK